MPPITPKTTTIKKGDGTPKVSLNKSKNKVLQQHSAAVASAVKKSEPKKASPKKSPRKSSSSSSSSSSSTNHNRIDPSLEVVLPSTLDNNNGECTILVQIDPDDATTLDFEGATGAIGRFQADDQGIVLDLKGSQYRGTILPGPSVLLASLHYTPQQTQQLRIDALTDEFCPLVKTQDILAKFDAQIEGTMDESYQLQEEDVNVLAREERQLEAKEKKANKNKKEDNNNSNSKKAAATTNSSAKKRASSGGGNKGGRAAAGGSNKKQKISLGKK